MEDVYMIDNMAYRVRIFIDGSRDGDAYVDVDVPRDALRLATDAPVDSDDNTEDANRTRAFFVARERVVAGFDNMAHMTNGYVRAHIRTGDFEIIPPSCYACDENDVDEWGNACPGCAMRAMHALLILEAIQHLIDGDEHIAAVVEHDNIEAHKHAGRQYVTLRDAAMDMRGDVDPDDLMRMWAPSIANAIHAMGR